MFEYSIVIPVYNEEESIDVLFDEIKKCGDNLSGAYEVVFVNDCSDDQSRPKLQALHDAHPQIVHIVDLPKRSGQTAALRKGLDEARGEIIITLDADLQNDPADIPALLAKMYEGYDVVCGWRRDRQDPPLKKMLSKLGNILQRLFTGMTIHDVSCTLRAYRRTCADALPLDREGQHRFIPLILSKKGFKVSEIVSHHRDRQYGYSKYTHKRIFKVIADFFKILSM